MPPLISMVFPPRDKDEAHRAATPLELMYDLASVIAIAAAARGDPERRVTALRYAGGIAGLQAYWVVITLIRGNTDLMSFLPVYLAGMAGELAVPVWAERHRTTPWHRHHIIERYGLLTIIVLGECFLAITAMFRLDAASVLPDWHLVLFATLSAIITFSMWAMYFTDEEHLDTDELPHALLWGYGHSVLFAAGAAVGACPAGSCRPGPPRCWSRASCCRCRSKA